MSTDDRLGLSLGPEGPPPLDCIDLVRDMEDLGFTDIWTAEVAEGDSLAQLAALAATTGRVRLGSAIVSVFSRAPFLLAMGASTIQQISRGRFVLGLGTSTEVIVEQWAGGTFATPLARLREYVPLIRRILTGDRIEFVGNTTQVHGFRLRYAPEIPPPIYVAALAKKACELAGELADGAILFLKTPDTVRVACTWVSDGAVRAGRQPEDIDVVMRLPVFLGKDSAELRQSARRLIAGYAVVDVYNRSLCDQGYQDEATSLVQAWRAGDRDRALACVTDDMVEQLVILGDPDHCRERLQGFRGAGVTTPVLWPVFSHGTLSERIETFRNIAVAFAKG